MTYDSNIIVSSNASHSIAFTLRMTKHLKESLHV